MFKNWRNGGKKRRGGRGEGMGNGEMYTVEKSAHTRRKFEEKNLRKIFLDSSSYDDLIRDH